MIFAEGKNHEWAPLCPGRPGGRAFPSACDHIWRMVKMRFGTDELGIDELGIDGLVNLRLVKPSCAS